MRCVSSRFHGPLRWIAKSENGCHGPQKGICRITWLLAWCPGAHALCASAVTGSAGCRQLSTDPRLTREGAVCAPPGGMLSAMIGECARSALRYSPSSFCTAAKLPCSAAASTRACRGMQYEKNERFGFMATSAIELTAIIPYLTAERHDLAYLVSKAFSCPDMSAARWRMSCTYCLWRHLCIKS